jgi:hypothetical protein
MALMTGPFASDFPAEYARRWRQRWLFAALISAYARSTVTTDKTLREILAPLALPDRLVLWALRLLPYKLAGLAAFLWLRPFDIPMAVRDAVRSWGKMMFK